MPLLWAIRNHLGFTGTRLTGTRYGYGIAQCGSCTLCPNGALVRACTKCR